MDTQKTKNYLVVILLILFIIFFSNLFSQKNPNPDSRELLAAPSQGEQQSCDPPMEWIDGECVDPGPGGGGGGVSVSAPTLTTSAATSVGEDGATLNGSISDAGGENSTARGFNYGTTQSYGSNTTESGSFSTGDFTAVLTGLTCDTDYYFRAYASNSGGTGTGSAQTFTTDSCSSVSNNNSQSGSGESGGSQNQVSNSSGSSGGSGPITVTPSPAVTPTTTPTTATPTPAVLPAPVIPAVETPSAVAQVPPRYSASIIPPPDLFLGNFGQSVYYLQIFLNHNGFPLALTGPGAIGQETHTFGPLTEASLKLFQQAYSLPVTGYYGRLTWEAMNRLQSGQ